jgi:hypothetical protein
VLAVLGRRQMAGRGNYEVEEGEAQLGVVMVSDAV